jgi:pyruvate, orthophosphate dikinase
MLGTRGCRLGIIKPDLYRMQTRALIAAAIEVQREGGEPRVEIMIPLVAVPEELLLLRGWVREAADAVLVEAGAELDYEVGTMIETPRAALCAGALALAANFFSFGTNDLTQMTFGLSRDDVEARIVAPYLAEGILRANPFERLDDDGVGRLLRIAVAEGREARHHFQAPAAGPLRPSAACAAASRATGTRNGEQDT